MFGLHLFSLLLLPVWNRMSWEISLTRGGLRALGKMSRTHLHGNWLCPPSSPDLLGTQPEALLGIATGRSAG